MKKKIRILTCILGSLILVSCKNQSPDTPEIAKDTLVQYFQYKLDNTVHTITEKENTRFTPSIRLDSIATDTSELLYTLKNFVNDYDRSSNQSELWGISLSMRIYSSQLNSKLSRDGIFCPNLKTGVLKSLLSPGRLPIIEKVCTDSITYLPIVEIVFKSIGTEMFFLSPGGDCSDSFMNTIYNQDSSFFKIEQALEYTHKVYGKGMLIKGSFRVNLFLAPLYSWGQKLSVSEGKFNLLLTDNCWQ